MSATYPFIDIAVLGAVRSAFAAGRAVIVLDADANEILWANSGGAVLLGSSVAEIIGRPFSRGIARRQIAGPTQRLPDGGRIEVLVRLEDRFGAPLVPVSVTVERAPDGERVLVAATDPREMSAAQRHAEILATFGEATPVALFADETFPVASTAAFDALDPDFTDLGALRIEVGGESDRMVKRPIKAARGLFPSGIARLSDRPRLDLLIIIGEPVSPGDNASAPAIGTALDADSDRNDAEPDAPAHAPDMAPPSDGAAPDTDIDTDTDAGTDTASANANVGSGSSASETPAGGRPSFSDAPRVDPEILNVDEELLPVRFTWETDADNAFVSLSPEFERAVGASAGQYVGLMPDYILDLLPADRRRLVGVLEKGRRFSDRMVAWGVRSAGLRVPVTFSGVPRYSEKDRFEGFRGHGSVRMGDAVYDETASLPHRGDEPPDAPVAQGEPVPPPETPKQLTDDERKAFDEIASTLRGAPEGLAENGTAKSFEDETGQNDAAPSIAPGMTASAASGSTAADERASDPASLRSAPGSPGRLAPERPALRRRGRVVRSASAASLIGTTPPRSTDATAAAKDAPSLPSKSNGTGSVGDAADTASSPITVEIEDAGRATATADAVETPDMAKPAVASAPNGQDVASDNDAATVNDAASGAGTAAAVPDPAPAVVSSRDLSVDEVEASTPDDPRSTVDRRVREASAPRVAASAVAVGLTSRPSTPRVIGNATMMPFRSRAPEPLFGRRRSDAPQPAEPETLVPDAPIDPDGDRIARARRTIASIGEPAGAADAVEPLGETMKADAAANGEARPEAAPVARERPSEAYRRRLTALSSKRQSQVVPSGALQPRSKTSKHRAPLGEQPTPDTTGADETGRDLAGTRNVDPDRKPIDTARPEGGPSQDGASSTVDAMPEPSFAERVAPEASPATRSALDRVKAAAEGRQVADAPERRATDPRPERRFRVPRAGERNDGPLDVNAPWVSPYELSRDAANDMATERPGGETSHEPAAAPSTPAAEAETVMAEPAKLVSTPATQPEAGVAATDSATASDTIADVEPEPETEPATETLEESAAQPAATRRSPPVVDTTLLGRLPVPVLVQNTTGLLYANEPFLKLSGYASLDDLSAAGGMGALFDSSISPGAADAPDSPMRLKRRDGSERPVSAQMQTVPWRTDDGESSTAYLLTIRAADDKGRPLSGVPDEIMPGAIEDRLVSLNAVLDEATDGVVFLDADRNIRSLSRSAAELMGYSGGEVRGRSFAILFAPESQRSALNLIGTVGGDGPRRRSGVELMGLTAGDDEVPLFVTIGALRDEGGFCAVLRDVSDWRRSEDELRAARDEAEAASREKSRFLTRISHEIRTPLNAIIGFAEVMAEERLGPVSNPRYREYLADIRSSGRHVLDLVNDLLDIAKIESGRDDLRFEAVDVNAELRDAVNILSGQADEGRIVVRQSLGELPPVVADRRSVKQIALNIISNAIRFTEPGGQVIVSTKLTGDGVMVRIRDTGIGMSQDDIDRALEPFAQAPARSASMARRSRGGTGLGLPLSKAMAEANRAHFTLSSVRGRGTLVELRFPPERVLD